MDSDERIRYLEAELSRLREKEHKLEHDLALYRQIFEHLKKQFEDMRRELLNK